MDNFKFFRIFLLCIGGALAAPQMAMAQASAYEKIEIEKWPKLEYKHGDNFDISGISVRISYSDNSATSDDDCEDGENFESGKCYKIVEYDDFATDIDVEVTIGTGTAVSNNFGDIELKLEDNNKDINIKVTYGENNDAISNGTDGNGETNTLTVSPIQVNPIQIAISTPVTGETPSGSASVTQSNSSNAVDGIKGTGTEFDITWKANGTDFTGKFKGNTEYTAVVELEADDDYVFAALTTVPGLEECTNSSSSDPALLSVDNAGKKLTITCVFPPTAPAKVAEITITSMPTKLKYDDGESIVLDSLKVKLVYEDDEEETIQNNYSQKLTITPSGALATSNNGDKIKACVTGQSPAKCAEATDTLRVITTIKTVAVSVVVPAYNVTPNSTATVDNTNANPANSVNSSTVTWEGALNNGKFDYGEYTAKVTLTPDIYDHVFNNTSKVTFNEQEISPTPMPDTNGKITIERIFSIYDPTKVTSITITDGPTKTTYEHGDALDYGGLKVELTMDGGTKNAVTFEDFGDDFEISHNGGDPLAYSASSKSVTITVRHIASAKDATKQISITVSKAAGSGAIVAITNWIEGQTASEPSIVWNNQPGTGTHPEYANPTWKWNDSDDLSSATTQKPTTEGTYYVWAQFAQTANYLAYSTEPAEFVIYEPISEDKIVSEVKITMEAPATGEPFIIAAADVTVVESEDEFTVTSVTWTPATSGNKFAPETEYTVEIKLTAEPGYTFDGYPAPNQNPRINGQGADTANNTGATIEITYKFPKTEPAAPGPKITNFSVVNQPRKLDYVTGEKLSLNGLKLSLQWDKAPEPGKTLPETLEYGDADFGEYFTTDPEHGVNLSMSDDGMPIAINAINSAAAPRYTEPMHVSEQTIGNISVKIDRPITDEKPSKEAEIAAGAGFDVYSVVWNPNHEMFQSKRQYAVIITLAAKTGYAFNKENPSVLINGAEPTLITVGNKGATLTLSYTFEPTKEIVVVKVGGEILDNNNRQFYYVPKCGESNPEITVSAGTDEVTIHGEGSFETGLDDLLFGENIFTMSTGDGKDYELIISKPMPTENMVRMRWDNTFTIIDNEYYDPKNTYKWYRNGREAGSGRSWSIGVNGEKINKADSYYVEATAESGKKLRSCEIEAPPPPAAKPQYGIMLKDGLEVLAPEKSETDIFIYNAAGKLAAKLNGNHINAKNINIPNGLYFVRARAIGESGAVYRYSAKLVVRNK